MKIKNVIAVILSISLCFNVIGVNVYADEEITTTEQQNEINTDKQISQDVAYNEDEEGKEIDYSKPERNVLRTLYDEALENSREKLEEIPNETKVYLTEIFESDEINVSSNMELVINKNGQQYTQVLSFNINDIEFDLDTIDNLGIDFFIRDNDLSAENLNKMLHFLQAQYNNEISSGKDKIKIIDDMIVNMLCTSYFMIYFSEYGAGDIFNFSDFLLQEKFSIYQIFNRFNLSNNEYAVRYINQVYDNSDNVFLLTMTTAILLARNPNDYFVTIITNVDKTELKNFVKDVLGIDSTIFEFNNSNNEIIGDTDIVITDYNSYSSAIAYDITQLFRYTYINDLLGMLNIADVNVEKNDDENIIKVNFANSYDTFTLFDFMKNGSESFMCQSLDKAQKENIDNLRNEIFETIYLYIPYERLSDCVCDDAIDIVEEFNEPSVIENNVITQTNSIAAFNSFGEEISFTYDLAQIDNKQVLNDMGFYISEAEYVDIEDIPQSNEIFVKIESEQAKVYAQNQEKLNIERITQQEAEEKYSKEVVGKIQDQLGDTRLDYIKSKYDENFVDEIEYLYNDDKQKIYSVNSSYTKEQINEIVSEIQNPKISDQMWFALYNYEQTTVLASKFNIDEVEVISQEEINYGEVPENTMIVTSIDLIQPNITSILTSLFSKVIKYKDKKMLDKMIISQADLTQVGKELIELKNSMSDTELNKIKQIEQDKQGDLTASLVQEQDQQQESKFKKFCVYFWNILTYTIESYFPGTNFNKYKKIKNKIRSKVKEFNKLQDKFLNIFEERNTMKMLFNGIRYEDGWFYFNF